MQNHFKKKKKKSPWKKNKTGKPLFCQKKKAKTKRPVLGFLTWHRTTPRTRRIRSEPLTKRRNGVVEQVFHPGGCSSKVLFCFFKGFCFLFRDFSMKSPGDFSVFFFFSRVFSWNFPIPKGPKWFSYTSLQKV